MMTPGKLQWRQSESFYRHKRLRTSGKDILNQGEASTNSTSGCKSMKSGLSRHRLLLDMLRGFMKMDVREKERQDVHQDPTESEDTSSSSFSDGGSALIQCVERFFKNPQQNYEVPLQLLQEWFSDTSTHRKQELAKLFLSLLQEQGLDMDRIYSESCKSDEVFLEVEGSSKKEIIEIESDSQMETDDLGGEPLELRDEDSSSAKTLEWVESSNSDASPLISDPVVLRTLREYRPMPVKSKADTFFEAVGKKVQLSETVHVDVPSTEPNGEQMTVMNVAEQEGNRNLESSGFTIAHCEDYPGKRESTLASGYSPIERDRTTRSVGTSPFQEGSLTTKCSSEPNIQKVCSEFVLNDKRKSVGGLRKSQSLPSVRCSEAVTEVPLLVPLELSCRKPFVSKETCTVRTNDYSHERERKPTVISSTASPTPTTYKARTTFVEMSHAEFMKRQMLLNEKVNVRQGFRLGGQILYVPELVSCSAPHLEKQAPPLLLHSNVDVKRSRNQVEIKLAMMGANEVLENVVVSQTSSSHTIHYTPQSHIASAPTHPSHLINDKCSVVYVRESLPHAQPVLVATKPTTTWQEEARKKPIIAYAKKKPAENREKPGGILGDNMKMSVAPNRVVNSEVPPKVIAHCKPVEREKSNGVVSSTGCGMSSVTSAISATATTSGNDVVFVKRISEERRNSVAVVPTETAPTKATLPKFNQTFVQNFQIKQTRTTDSSSETQTIDYLRKIPKKVIVPFSPLSQVGADTTVVTDENGSVTQDIVIDEPVAVTHTHIQPTSGVIHSALSSAPTPVVERPVQVKAMSNAPPTQVGLLIYTQGSSEESSPVQTLLLTTLPNGSAYCVRLPPNANLHNVSTPAVSPQIDTTGRPLVVQAVQHGTPVTVKTTVKKTDSIPVAPPAESNKVALLKDLKEFENVFEETKLKFEKEKQLNIGEVGEVLSPVVSVESVVPPPPPPPPAPTPQSQAIVTAIPKFDCEKVVVGVKRKPDGDIPVVTRLYTTAKKPLIVVANYGQSAPTQVQARPMVTQICSTSPPAVSHLANKAPKVKSRTGKTYPCPAKSPPTTKPQQKPQEDEKTQQKIFAILEEYAVQKEHSPDTNNRPAPRRRSNPTSASASKKKRPLPKNKEASGDSEDGSFSEM